jgi:hypothetical protein
VNVKSEVDKIHFLFSRPHRDDTADAGVDYDTAHGQRVLK